MTSRARLNLFVLMMLALALVGSGVVAWVSFQRQAAAATTRSANLLMEAALGIRNYTNIHIQPELNPLLEQRFLPQTVPSFSAIESLGAIRGQFPDYTYREAALNPTNRRDLAKPWEEAIIRKFQADPLLAEATGTLQDNGRELHYAARPIKITDPTCLRCHSTPAQAPRTMLATYGDKGGFGWALGDIVGAQIVTVPTAVPQGHAWDGFVRVMAGILTVFVLLFAGFARLLSKYVDD
jgi:two-component system, cell cycle response regulator